MQDDFKEVYYKLLLEEHSKSLAEFLEQLRKVKNELNILHEHSFINLQKLNQELKELEEFNLEDNKELLPSSSSDKEVEIDKFNYQNTEEYVLIGKKIESFINKDYIDKRTRLSSSQFFAHGAMEYAETKSYSSVPGVTRIPLYSILLENLEVVSVYRRGNLTKYREGLPKIPYGVVILRNKASQEEVSYPALEHIAIRLKNKKLEFGEFLVVEQIDSIGLRDEPRDEYRPSKICWIVDIISIKDKDSLDLLEKINS